MTAKQRADWILESVSHINPYRRQALNQKSEYYLWQLGWLAGHLASILEDDPIRAREFKQHVERRARERAR